MRERGEGGAKYCVGVEVVYGSREFCVEESGKKR